MSTSDSADTTSSSSASSNQKQPQEENQDELIIKQQREIEQEVGRRDECGICWSAVIICFHF